MPQRFGQFRIHSFCRATRLVSLQVPESSSGPAVDVYALHQRAIAPLGIRLQLLMSQTPRIARPYHLPRRLNDSTARQLPRVLREDAEDAHQFHVNDVQSTVDPQGEPTEGIFTE